MSDERKPKSYKFQPETVEKIDELKAWLTASATAVVVRGINELWEREAQKRGLSND